MMPSKSPDKSKERKRLLRAFFDLPLQEKRMFYQALEHLRWLMILWGLDELDADSRPSIPEKLHILLAYKYLHIIWFDRLPDQNDQTLTIHVRDRLPEDQNPEAVNKAFDLSAELLADLCKDRPRPPWLKNSIEVKTSIESFPQKT